ncbi:hypothetical protein LPJ59_004695 [Coemansia sp. RSA 2399]|nr:hypothetical protein LPJ59_004695 [Coemansia sp. RSA 2399]
MEPQTESAPVVEAKGDPTLGQNTAVFCPADNAIYQQCTMHLYYHNHDRSPGFMDFDVLRESLYQTLRASMRLALATDMKQTSVENGGLTATLSDTPLYPSIARHVDHEHTIAKMAADGYSLASQPPVMTNCAAVANPLAGDALVAVDVVYLKDGVGLSFAASHAVTDLSSLVMVACEWGNVAKAMHTGRYAQYAYQAFDVDRARFWERVSACAPGDALKTTRDLEERWVAEQHSSPPCVAQKNPFVITETPMHRIRISAKSVVALKRSRPADCHDISVGALISAALWQAHTKAHPDQPHTYYGSSVTIRADPQFAGFCGNTSTVDYIRDDPAYINTLSAYEVARVIQRRIRAFTAGDFVHYVKCYSDATFAPKMAALVSSNHRATLVTVNVSRLPLYDIDFGYGRPCKFVCPKIIVAERFCIMAPQDADGGFEIYTRIPQETIEMVQETELLSGHIEIVKYE